MNATNARPIMHVPTRLSILIPARGPELFIKRLHLFLGGEVDLIRAAAAGGGLVASAGASRAETAGTRGAGGGLGVLGSGLVAGALEGGLGAAGAGSLLG